MVFFIPGLFTIYKMSAMDTATHQISKNNNYNDDNPQLIRSMVKSILHRATHYS